MRKSIAAITGTIAGTALLTALKLGIAPVGAGTTVTSEPPAAGGAVVGGAAAPAPASPPAPTCSATFRNAAADVASTAPANWRTEEDGGDGERTGTRDDGERTGTGDDGERSGTGDDGRESERKDGDDAQRGGGQGPGASNGGAGGTSTGPASPAAPPCPSPSTPPCSCSSPSASAPAPSAPAPSAPAPSKPGSPATPSKPGSGLRDGTFRGAASTNQYGTVQTTVSISGGRITQVTATYPTSPGTTAQINARAIPALRKEALAAQSATIDSVSGATYTSGSYKKSLQSAIDAARA
ncbi:FMN-binding protein [Streptomyces shenzhenensis]|uniref:FMN-binding protein n=1 Tax=Streptomyces shenzhenensis TaxID=943815 RepID=UPI001F44A5F4|nr:FMN-binding protein [Streptomyces shenzhenensis]